MVQLIDVAEHLVPHVCYLDAARPVDPRRMSTVTGQWDRAPFDWVVSVEVGEHIPGENANMFLDNLVSSADLGVILTWAVRGQGGRWHVNELDNAEVVKLMENRGLKYQMEESMRMRRNVEKLAWLRNTIMLFTRM